MESPFRVKNGDSVIRGFLKLSEVTEGYHLLMVTFCISVILQVDCVVIFAELSSCKNAQCWLIHLI